MTESLDSTVLDEIIQHALHIRVKELSVGQTDLATNVTDEKILQAISSFATLQQIWFIPNETSVAMQNFLLQNGFRIGVSLKPHRRRLRGSVYYCNVADESLMQYSFGACADNCGACDRSIRLSLTSLSPLFLARWIAVRKICCDPLIGE